jgi:hypothetical protein
MNLFGIVKRVWALCLGSNETWAHTLRCKYSDTHNANCRKSFAWNSIMHASTICDKGMGRLINNGCSINLWSNNWLGSGPICNLVSVPL